MAFSRQTIQIVGNLGRDAEMRYAPSGAAVTAFSVAATLESEYNGQKYKETAWFKVTCWNKTAEATAKLRKGQKVLVIGRMTPDKTTGGPRIWSRQDGTAGAEFEVRAQEVWLNIFEGGGEEQASGTAVRNFPTMDELPPAEDDIPF